MHHFPPVKRTFQSVNRPLFKLFKCYLCSWRDLIEVQTVRIILLLVCRCSKLLLPVIEDSPLFGINSVDILPNHFELQQTDRNISTPSSVLWLKTAKVVVVIIWVSASTRRATRAWTRQLLVTWKVSFVTLRAPSSDHLEINSGHLEGRNGETVGTPREFLGMPSHALNWAEISLKLMHNLYS